MHLRPDNLRAISAVGRMAAHAAAGRAEDAMSQAAPMVEILRESLPLLGTLSLYAIGAYLLWRALDLRGSAGALSPSRT